MFLTKVLACFLGLLVAGSSLQATGPFVGVRAGAVSFQGVRTDLSDAFALAYDQEFQPFNVFSEISGGYEWSFLLPFVRLESFVGYEGLDKDVSLEIPTGVTLHSHLRAGLVAGGALSAGLSLGVMCPYVKVGFGTHQIRHTYQEVQGSTIVDTKQSQSFKWAPSFGGGLMLSLLGLGVSLDYLYTPLPETTHSTYNNPTWKNTQTINKVSIHKIALGLSYLL